MTSVTCPPRSTRLENNPGGDARLAPDELDELDELEELEDDAAKPWNFQISPLGMFKTNLLLT